MNLQYTKIVAPVSGEVNKTVVVGMNVQAGQQLLTVVPWTKSGSPPISKRRSSSACKPDRRRKFMWIRAAGHSRAMWTALPGPPGPLFSLLPPENATGNYVKIVQSIPVKIVLEPGENRDHQLRPGMNVVPDVYLQ